MQWLTGKPEVDLPVFIYLVGIVTGALVFVERRYYWADCFLDLGWVWCLVSFSLCMGAIFNPSSQLRYFADPTASGATIAIVLLLLYQIAYAISRRAKRDADQRYPRWVGWRALGLTVLTHLLGVYSFAAAWTII